MALALRTFQFTVLLLESWSRRLHTVMAKLIKVCNAAAMAVCVRTAPCPLRRPHAPVPYLMRTTSLCLQMLQPLQTEYVDRRFDGTKARLQLLLRASLAACALNTAATVSPSCYIPKCLTLILNLSDTCAQDEYFEQLGKSATLYIGNLSFYTSEDQACTYVSPLRLAPCT